MAPLLPIALSGDNLGQRQRHFNSLVREANDCNASFQDIEAQPEMSPLDRLFKIDLASKLKNVDYIIHNLKDDDMLYVSRALKSTWLLDRQDIVNPKYLEEVLFPEMITQAVSKMKHWLYINLRDPSLCLQFYQYYKEKAFHFAIKFLVHCTNEFIIDEVSKILTKISNHYLKVLSEKCPKVAKIYFDSLAVDEDVRSSYLIQQQSYYTSVKCTLKSDADVFLDITEKYFNIKSFSRLSASATDYILRFHRTRFSSKLELYVAYLLHIPTLANRLTVEECQEVVLKLARARYLRYWFQYKAVEPLIKRLSPDKRSAFKKRVFVEKDVGELVDEWPYETPAPPPSVDSGPYLFDDVELEELHRRVYIGKRKRLLNRHKCSRYSENCGSIVIESSVNPELRRLFDEFRFIGFDRALHDLGQRLDATESTDKRLDMFLVLVSKSGGRVDAVSALLHLAIRHSNEPAHMRAAVLRSLVKRANVWRLPADVWQHLMNFGHGLGLDGTTPEATCLEGLHAVMIRHLIAGEYVPAISNAFLSNFSTLAEYSLMADEQSRVAVGLQKMLLAAAVDAEPTEAATHLNQLLDVLQVYHLHVDPASSTVKAVMTLALRDAEIARPLQERLYNSRVARRELFHLNMEFRKDEAALLNALRHEPSALDLERVVDMLSAGKSCFDRFVTKVVLYFNQKEDIATQLRAALEDKFNQEQNVKLIRPLACFIGFDIENNLSELDAAGTERIRSAAALRACAHRSRPVLKLAKWGWQKIGVKAVATQAICCREVERAELICVLAAERRTVRVALALSMRSEESSPVDTLASAVKLRPSAALRGALMYFRHRGVRADLQVWDIVKPLISYIDLSSRRCIYLRRLLGKTEWIPLTIKPDYCETLHTNINDICNSTAARLLRDLAQLLPEVSNEFIENILLRMLEQIDEDVPEIQYPALFIRYLMLSLNDEDLKRRFEKIGERFLECMDTLRCKKESSFQLQLDQVMENLKYNAAFFDPKFTSCLAVIQRILAWMEEFMSKEEYFEKYAHLHLTMLYLKAVRQSVKQMPDVFSNIKRKKLEGVEAVGYSFGRYISKEVANLVCSYFDSMIELYSNVLVNYLINCFKFGGSKAIFMKSVVKGMLAEGVGSQRRMAVYVLKDRRYGMDDYMAKELEELMIEDKAIEFFVHAEFFT